VDNVLLPLYRDIGRHLSGAPIHVYRLRSYLQPRARTVPSAIDVEVNKRDPSALVHAVRQRLLGGMEVTLVGATPEQVHNLIMAGGGGAQEELFDYILIDESSQMDVAHAILALCGLATEGSVTLAGDPKQLPPIHTAVAPLDLESMVGSIYAFCEDLHHVEPIMLDVNYRSNKSLVDFSHNAGYRRTLSSHSPDLCLHLLPSAMPAVPWPSSLYQTPEWDALLDPDHPATCFVYPEGSSSQWNAFEAEAVAALVMRLYGRMANQLDNERDAAGAILPPSNVTVNSSVAPYDASFGVLLRVCGIHLLLGNVKLAHIPDHDRGRIAPQVAQVPQRAQEQAVPSIHHRRRLLDGLRIVQARRFPPLLTLDLGPLRGGFDCCPLMQ
jgi:hypothetical protein